MKYKPDFDIEFLKTSNVFMFTSKVCKPSSIIISKNILFNIFFKFSNSLMLS